jgi:putative restriction endonuclease
MHAESESIEGSEPVGIRELNDRKAVLRAITEFDSLGRDEFLATYHFGKSTRYYLIHGTSRYDAKAIAGVAYSHQFPNRKPLINDDFSGGLRAANAALQHAGFFILDAKPEDLEGERVCRLRVWKQLQAGYNVNAIPPQVLRTYGVYSGQQGIWTNAERTKLLEPTAGRTIVPTAITVGILHTGSHYPDDISTEGVLYHYPSTSRGTGRDRSEVEATKTAARLGLPIFMIAYPTINSAVRSVHLAWVEGWDDQARTFLVSFGDTAPSQILSEDHSDDEPFSLETQPHQRATRNVINRPDQRKFKFQVLQRYGSRCPLSGVAVTEMLDAAHLRPVADRGSSDPRNGLPLNAALHRAFDAHLFAIHPDTLAVAVRPQGPSLEELGITSPNIRGLAKTPHHEALTWRYELWRSKLPATVSAAL